MIVLVLLLASSGFAAEALETSRSILSLSLVSPESDAIGQQIPDENTRTWRKRKTTIAERNERGLLLAFVRPEHYASLRAMPAVNMLTVEARRRGVDLLCVFPKVSRGKARSYIVHKGVVGEALMDKSGDLHRFLGEPEYPYYVAIDATGQVVYASSDMPRLD